MIKSHTNLDKRGVLSLQFYKGKIKVVISIPISTFFFITVHKVFYNFSSSHRMKICLFEIWIRKAIPNHTLPFCLSAFRY